MGLTEALAIGSLVLPFFGGGDTGKQSAAPGGIGEKDGLMADIFGVSEGMFGNLLMSKFQEGGKASSRVGGYMPDIEGLLESHAMKGAGGIDKLHAVNPKDNDRAMEMLLTKMLTSPVYSERIG